MASSGLLKPLLEAEGALREVDDVASLSTKSAGGRPKQGGGVHVELDQDLEVPCPASPLFKKR
eukprot:1578924-Amphidinium_carterae.1